MSIDHIIAQYDVRGVSKVNAAHQSMAASAVQADNATGGLSAGLSALSGPASLATAAITGLTVATTAAVAGIAMAAREGAQLESKFKALQAVEGSMAGAEAAFMSLRDIAKAPGIAFQESIDAYTQLKRVLGDGSFAKDLIREFGNMNALAGGTAESFDRIVRAVQQIATKPFLQGEELLQLTEAGVPAYKIMQNAFGTTDTQALKSQGIGSAAVLSAILAELKKAPRVDGGSQNSFENLSQSLQYGLAEIGMGVNTGLKGVADNFNASIERLIDSGSLRELGNSIATQIDLVFGDLSAQLDTVVVSLMNIADAAGTVFAGLKAGVDAVANLKRFLPWLPADIASVAGVGDMSGDNAQIVAMRRAIADKKRANAKASEAIPESMAATAQAESVAKEIMKTTAETFRQMSYRGNNMARGVFGGGELGRFGVTADELKRAQNGRLEVKVQARDLEDGVRSMVLDIFNQLQRQGAFAN